MAKKISMMESFKEYAEKEVVIVDGDKYVPLEMLLQLYEHFEKELNTFAQLQETQMKRINTFEKLVEDSKEKNKQLKMLAKSLGIMEDIN